MNKNEYMKVLAHSLRRLPKEDFDQAMEYFEEYFADAGPENEQKAIEDLGTPKEAAKELIMNLAAKNASEPPKTVKRSFKAVWICLLAVCAAPIALPLTLALVVLVASLILAALFLLVSIWVGALAVIATAVIGLVGGIALLFQTPANGLATLGFSFLCAGIGIAGTYLMFLLCKWFLQKSVQFLGKIMKRKKGGRKDEHMD